MTATDRLLAALAANLRGSRSARRRLLAEIREDICDAVQAERRSGLDPAAAEDVVVARFGSPLALAARWNSDHLERRGAVRRNVALVLIVAAAASALGITQLASGKSPPVRPNCAGIRVSPDCGTKRRTPPTTTTARRHAVPVLRSARVTAAKRSNRSR
jgi:hypothetical protein